MIKIILVSCAVLAVAKENLQQYNNDDYINLNNLQYSKVLEEYDAKLKHFEDHYLGRIEGINVQLDMISASIVQTEERLMPYELLSDTSKHCVVSHRKIIPSAGRIRRSVTHCISEANNEVKNLLKDPVTTRNYLESYYKNHFDKEIENCRIYSHTETNYTACIVHQVYDANSVTSNNQKLFENQLEVAECSAKADIKRSLDCSYTIQTNTITKIAEANLLINKCLEGEDQCKPCDARYTCSESIDWDLDAKSHSILNPFYGREDHPSCVMLKLSDR